MAVVRDGWGTINRCRRDASALAWASVLGLEMVGLFLSNITLANGGYFQILTCAQVAFISAAMIAVFQVIIRSGPGRWVLLALAIVPNAFFFWDNLRRMKFG